jgi:hypothetical protein
MSSTLNSPESAVSISSQDRHSGVRTPFLCFQIEALHARNGHDTFCISQRSQFFFPLVFPAIILAQLLFRQLRIHLSNGFYLNLNISDQGRRHYFLTFVECICVDDNAPGNL